MLAQFEHYEGETYMINLDRVVMLTPNKKDPNNCDIHMSNKVVTVKGTVNDIKEKLNKSKL